MSHVKAPEKTRTAHARCVNLHGYGVAVSIFAVILAGFFLLRANAPDEIPGTVLLANAQTDSTLLLAQTEDNVVAAFSGDDSATVLTLDAYTGEVSAQLDLPMPLQWAAVRGLSLFVREDCTDGITLAEYDTKTLTVTDSYQLGIKPDSIIHFDCDESGNCFYVLSGDRATLHGASAAGAGRSYTFSGKIEFFECTANGTLWVYSGEQLYRAEPEDEFVAVEFTAVPYHLPSDGYLIDTDGVLYSVATAQPEPLYRCDAALYSRLSFCMNSDGCLIVSKTGGSVAKFDLSGNAAGQCKLEKNAMAVCACGAVYSKGKDICYAPFIFGTVEASPSPSPSPTVQPTAAPSLDDVPAYAEGDYIIVPSGTTVDELRELFKPEAVIVRSQNGEKALNGRLSTGMTVGNWTIVVEGDCNGTGSVNIADLKIAMTLVIYEAHPEDTYEITDACRRAADLNNNGIADTDDLVLLVKMINQTDK